MGKVFVKNGTPVGGANLCRSCTWGQVMTGYRESDVMVICTNSDPAFKVPFAVYSCTEFFDKGKPDWEQMEKLAIEIEPARIPKTRGFNFSGPSRTEKPGFDVAADTEDEWENEEDAIAVASGRLR
jgi:hypothetical protein